MPLGRSAATQRDELGFRRTIELHGDRAHDALLAYQGGRDAFAHELLPDPHHLPLTQPHSLGDLAIRAMPVGMPFVGHQQNPSSTQLRRGRAMLTANRFELRPLRGWQVHAILLA